ncbi:MAG: carboxypeptidase regulatory-like domain-containing protein [Acidobacteria bacterium]|nr:carboxypeptidase regulatory-like domain-containing protein [Acidobacteriota bacterium]
MTRIVLAAFAALLPLTAQTISLQGVAMDAHNAAVSDAIVSLTNLETTAQRKALANPAGAYSFVQVPPGNCKIDAQKPGFQIT